MICAVFNPDMFISPIQSPQRSQKSEMSELLELLAQASTRPRYAFMVLNLIAEVASRDGSVGPFIAAGDDRVPLRDWLADALTPMGGRDPKRQALVDRVRDELEGKGELPADLKLANTLVENEVRTRVRTSAKTNLSRAVTELVKAGLLKRHYQGYVVDHLNRGAQRQAVYTLIGRAKCLLIRQQGVSGNLRRQGEFPFEC